MREAYKLQSKMIPSWLFKKNVEMIWDDHDFGENDGGSSYPLKQEAQKLYLDFGKFLMMILDTKEMAFMRIK